jgi:hypothetical protein
VLVVASKGEKFARDFDLSLDYLKVDVLKEYPENPKHHPDSQIAMLISLFEEFGFVDPVLVTADNVIIAGHGRLKSALQANAEARRAKKPAPYEELPVIHLPLVDADVEAYRLADNKLEENVKWDVPKLKTNIERLEAYKQNVERMTGFSKGDIEKIKLGTYDEGGRIEAPQHIDTGRPDDDDGDERGGGDGEGGGGAGGRRPDKTFDCPHCSAKLKYNRKGELEAVEP